MFHKATLNVILWNLLSVASGKVDLESVHDIQRRKVDNVFDGYEILKIKVEKLDNQFVRLEETVKEIQSSLGGLKSTNAVAPFKEKIDQSKLNTQASAVRKMLKNEKKMLREKLETFNHMFESLQKDVREEVTALEETIHTEMFAVTSSIQRELKQTNSSIEARVSKVLAAASNNTVEINKSLEKLTVNVEIALKDWTQELKDLERNFESESEQANRRLNALSYRIEGIIRQSSSLTEDGDGKPAAHLVGSVHPAEYHSASGDFFPIMHWESQEDLAFTIKVHYRYGRIVIGEDGLYYIYSQLSFLDGCGNTTDSVSLSHYIYRYNIVYPNGGEEPLIQSKMSRCRDRNKDPAEYTSYLGAVFYLRQGDEIFVKVSDLTLIVRDQKLNYLGLFKVN